MMGYIKDNELKELSNCKTVADMLKYLIETFDLNIYPAFLTKTILVNGLVQAIELLKPKRRVNITVKPNV